MSFNIKSAPKISLLLQVTSLTYWKSAITSRDTIPVAFLSLEKGRRRMKRHIPYTETPFSCSHNSRHCSYTMVWMGVELETHTRYQNVTMPLSLSFSCCPTVSTSATSLPPLIARITFPTLFFEGLYAVGQTVVLGRQLPSHWGRGPTNPPESPSKRHKYRLTWIESFCSILALCWEGRIAGDKKKACGFQVCFLYFRSGDATTSSVKEV